MARYFWLEAHLLTPAEARKAWPLLNVDDLVGGLFIPKDGQTNPVDTAMALARGARNGGARIVGGVKVKAIATRNGAVVGVRSRHGDVAAEFVVNSDSLWGQRGGRLE